MWLLFKSIIYLYFAYTTALLKNLALLKGQNLTHRCELQSSSWYFIGVGTNIEKIIYDEKGLNGEYVSRAQVDSSPLVNSSSLTILSVQLDDAGIYGCKTLHNSSILNERAQVIVIESNLQICRASESGLTCKVKYKGNFGPVIEWINNGSSDQFTINSTLINNSDASGARHWALVTNFVNSTLTCQLFFKDVPTHSPSMAINKPTYTDRRNSSDNYCYSYGGTTLTSSTSQDGDSPKKSNNGALLAAIIGSFVFILIIVVIGLIIEKKRLKRVFKKSKWKSRKKICRPVELPGPDVVQSDDTANVVINGVPEASLPVYALIVSDESDYLSADESQTFNQSRFVASDGTEYLMMRGMTGDITSSTGQIAAPVASRFTSMVYASIDHTLQPHSPQPQSPVSWTPSTGLFRHATSNQPPIPSPRNISKKH